MAWNTQTRALEVTGDALPQHYGQPVFVATRLRGTEKLGRLITENTPAFEARDGCKPEVLILNPVVALAVFGAVPEYGPIVFGGLQVLISAQVDVVRLAVKKPDGRVMH